MGYVVDGVSGAAGVGDSVVMAPGVNVIPVPVAAPN